MPIDNYAKDGGFYELQRTMVKSSMTTSQSLDNATLSGEFEVNRPKSIAVIIFLIGMIHS